MKLFHKSFLNILENQDPLQITNQDDINITNQDDINITNQDDINITNQDDIINLAPHFISGVKRPQHLIKTRRDYYIARDSITNTIYICFKHLLTIDIDNPIDQSVVIEHFSKIPETFRIYRTNRGFHVYCTSKEFDYRSISSVDMMFNNLCDPYYCVYSYIRGYCTRLNNKFNDFGKTLYQYVGKTGNKGENDRLVKLTNLMLQLSDRYKKDINMN
jgi:hypothetical protein